MTVRNEFNYLGRDIGSTQFVCGCNAVVSVQHVVFAIDFVKKDRRYGLAFQHDPLDACHAVQLNVALGPEIVLKVETFPDTADNRIKRDTANSSINSVKTPVTVIDFTKAFYFQIIFIWHQFSENVYKADHDPSL